ncbi:MAG TPA: type II toxin-antitoxin system VapC family toxin [Tepidisphaeraceae bacterium]|jgi:PIN domain nuclease of toxin-antitoxin system
MSEAVLDASAILALLHREKGHEQIESLLLDHSCLISTVNLSEVMTRLIDNGMSLSDARLALSLPNLRAIDFDLPLAQIAASLRPLIRKLGLSLGDRACVALARASAPATVYTADSAWRGVSLPQVKIQLLR